MAVQQFWNLHSADSTRKCAEWDHDVMDLEQVICSADPGHQRGGKRLTELSVTLPAGAVEDFVWTWQSECLLQDRVLGLLRGEGFTGFDVKPVNARFKKDDGNKPPTLWELVRTGWGGLASPESGIHLVEYCETCQHAVYSDLNDSGKLIDVAQWDGSDFFMVWPLPRLIFVTNRVAEFIRDHRLTGAFLMPVHELKKDPGLIAGYSPGRLSYKMPESRARELGTAAGIRET